MSIFGLMFFASLIISPIPGLLIGAISRKTGSDIKAGYFIFKFHIEQNAHFLSKMSPNFAEIIKFLTPICYILDKMTPNMSRVPYLIILKSNPNECLLSRDPSARDFPVL